MSVEMGWEVGLFPWKLCSQHICTRYALSSLIGILLPLPATAGHDSTRWHVEHTNKYTQASLHNCCPDPVAMATMQPSTHGMLPYSLREMRIFKFVCLSVWDVDQMSTHVATGTHFHPPFFCSPPSLSLIHPLSSSFPSSFAFSPSVSRPISLQAWGESICFQFAAEPSSSAS